MTSNIQPFTYEDHTVRVVTIDGEPWFVLADLCKVLDLSQPHRVAARLAGDMKGRTRMTTPGGDQEMTIVHSDGHVSISKTTKVTGKGQVYFVTRFLDGRLPKGINDDGEAA